MQKPISAERHKSFLSQNLKSAYKSNWFHVGWFVLFVAVQVLKSPEVLIDGRFWAEEGAFYWANALDQGPMANLWFVAPIADYLHFFSNLTTSIAVVLPMSLAPLLTAWASVLVMYAPVFVYQRLRPSELPAASDFGILLALTYAPGIALGEVFANSINAQTHLGLAVGVAAVFLDRAKHNLYWLVPLFVLSALSGMYAVALVPAVLLSTYRFRLWVELRYLLIAFLAAATVQVGVVLFAIASRSSLESRIFIGQSDPLALFIQACWQMLGLSFIGDTQINDFSKAFGVGTALLVLLVGVFFCLTLYQPHRADLVDTTLKTRLYVAATTFLCAEVLILVAGFPNGRYLVVPTGLMLILLFLATSAISNGRHRHVRLDLAIIAAIGAGMIIQNSTTLSSENYKCLDCTPWKTQVNEVELGDRQYFVHWPNWPSSGEGFPHWGTDSHNPEVRPAPHQIENVK